MKNSRTKSNHKLLLLLLLALISLVVLMSSFAKYTSKVEGEDTVKIAKWNVAISESKLTHEYTTNLLESDGEDKIIAPGVDGSIPITVTNNGDVDVTIENLEAEQTNLSGVPIKFSTDGSTFDTLENTITTLKGNLSSLIVPTGETEEVGTLYWQWPYEVDEDGNTADTNIGITSATGDERAEYKLKLAVTATQVAPKK